jgi:hypothetical protein
MRDTVMLHGGPYDGSECIIVAADITPLHLPDLTSITTVGLPDLTDRDLPAPTILEYRPILAADGFPSRDDQGRLHYRLTA